MANKRKTTSKSPVTKKPPARVTAAELHDQARVARRAGESVEVIDELLERARMAERAAK